MLVYHWYLCLSVHTFATYINDAWNRSLICDGVTHLAREKDTL